MCTLEKRGNLFILTLTGRGDDHRLHPDVIASLRSALSQAKSQAVKGSALITLSQPGTRFFSNGFDLRHAQSIGSPSAAVAELRRMVDLFRDVVSDLISLPMPTIAAVTGHAAAAGLLLALSHDYVVMASGRGRGRGRGAVVYMSELDIGMTLPDYFTAVIREKVGKGRRELVLKAEKMRAEEAKEMGIVDEVCGTAEEAVEKAVGIAEELGRRGWDGRVYAEIRKALLPEVCGVLGLESKAIVPSKL